MNIRIGRWQLEWHQRALHITREPDPNCPACFGGRGNWTPAGVGFEWDECACLDQLRTWRLPLAPRNRAYVEEPF